MSWFSKLSAKMQSFDKSLTETLKEDSTSASSPQGKTKGSAGDDDWFSQFENEEESKFSLSVSKFKTPVKAARTSPSTPAQASSTTDDDQPIEAQEPIDPGKAAIESEEVKKSKEAETQDIQMVEEDSQDPSQAMQVDELSEEVNSSFVLREGEDVSVLDISGRQVDDVEEEMKGMEKEEYDAEEEQVAIEEDREQSYEDAQYDHHVDQTSEAEVIEKESKGMYLSTRDEEVDNVKEEECVSDEKDDEDVGDYSVPEDDVDAVQGNEDIEIDLDEGWVEDVIEQREDLEKTNERKNPSVEQDNSVASDGDHFEETSERATEEEGKGETEDSVKEAPFEHEDLKEAEHGDEAVPEAPIENEEEVEDKKEEMIEEMIEDMEEVEEEQQKDDDEDQLEEVGSPQFEEEQEIIMIEEFGSEAMHSGELLVGRAAEPKGQDTEMSRLSQLEEAVERLTQELEAKTNEALRYSEVINAREGQVEHLSLETARLNNANDELKGRLGDLSGSLAGTEALTSEFTARLADAEAKYSQAVAAHDTTRAEMNKELKQLELKHNDAESRAEQFRAKHGDLLAEGERMSKLMGNLEATIRKNRDSLKEKDKKISALEKKLDGTESMLADKQKKLQDSEATLTKVKADLKKTTRRADDAESKLTLRDGEIMTTNQILVDTQVQLKESKEKLIEASQRADGEASRLGESSKFLVDQARTEYLTQLQSAARATAERESHLAQQIAELQAEAASTEERAIWREESARKEILDWQKRCESAELRITELSSAAEQAAAPLMAQIESLTEAADVKVVTWNSTLASMQTRLDAATADRNAAVASAAEAEDKMRALEGELTRTTAETATVEASRNQAFMGLEAAKTTIRSLQQEKKELLGRLNALQQMAATPEASEIQELKKKIQSLESEVEIARASSPSIPLSQSFGTISASAAELSAQPSSINASNNQRLRILEDEVTELRKELINSESARDHLSMELLNAGESELQRRLDATLILLGEAEDQIEDLTLDISDLRDTYKTQILTLMAELDTFR